MDPVLPELIHIHTKFNLWEAGFPEDFIVSRASAVALLGEGWVILRRCDEGKNTKVCSTFCYDISWENIKDFL